MPGGENNKIYDISMSMQASTQSLTDFIRIKITNAYGSQTSKQKNRLNYSIFFFFRTKQYKTKTMEHFSIFLTFSLSFGSLISLISNTNTNNDIVHAKQLPDDNKWEIEQITVIHVCQISSYFDFYYQIIHLDKSNTCIYVLYM